MAGDNLKDTQMDQSTSQTDMNEAFLQPLRQIVAVVSAQQMSTTAHSAPTQSGVQDLNDLKRKSADTSQPSDVATTSSIKRRLTRGDKKLFELTTEEIDLPANRTHKKLRSEQQISDSKETPVPKGKPGWPLGKPRGSKHQVTELPRKKHQPPKKRLRRLSTKQEESAEEKSLSEKGEQENSEQHAIAEKDEKGANKLEASMQKGVREEKKEEKEAATGVYVCLNEEQAMEFMSSIKERLFSISVCLTDINKNLSMQNTMIAEQNQLTKDIKELVIEVKDKCLPSGQ